MFYYAIPKNATTAGAKLKTHTRNSTEKCIFLVWCPFFVVRHPLCPFQQQGWSSTPLLETFRQSGHLFLLEQLLPWFHKLWTTRSQARRTTSGGRDCGYETRRQLARRSNCPQPAEDKNSREHDGKQHRKPGLKEERRGGNLQNHIFSHRTCE